jgi:hypothetical protein
MLELHPFLDRGRITAHLWIVSLPIKKNKRVTIFHVSDSQTGSKVKVKFLENKDGTLQVRSAE